MGMCCSSSYEDLGYEHLVDTRESRVRHTMGGKVSVVREAVEKQDSEHSYICTRGRFGKVLFKKDTDVYTKSHVYLNFKKAQLYFRRITKDPQEKRNVIGALKQISNENHPFVLKPHFSKIFEDGLYLETEYAEGRELYRCVQYFDGDVPEGTVVFFTAQISSGLNFLHERGILHGNLTLGHILLFKDGYVKINDFRHSVLLTGECKLCVTPRAEDYMAPEVLCEELCDSRLDWWSLGICVGVLLGKYPFDSKNITESICFDEPTLVKRTSRQLKSFMRGLLVKDPRTRIDSSDYKMHDLFRSINWEDLENKCIEPPIHINYWLYEKCYYEVVI